MISHAPHQVLITLETTNIRPVEFEVMAQFAKSEQNQYIY